MQIGEKIKARRIELNMTQKELATQMNVSSQLISKWETNVSTPSLEFLKDLCRVLRVGADYFLNDNATSAQSETGAQTSNSKAENNKKEKRKSTKPPMPVKAKVWAFSVPLMCVWITVMVMLIVYVFVPHANREKYFAAIEQSVHKSLDDYGYYNVKFSGTFDGEDIGYYYIYKGYLGDDGSVAYYKKEYKGYGGNIIEEIVKDGIILRGSDRAKERYETPENIKTLDDLFEQQLSDSENSRMDFDNKDIRYVRCTSYGYYMELKDSVYYDELSTTEKKHCKLREPLSIKVNLENGHLKSMVYRAKYYHNKDKETCVVESKVEFFFSKPVISQGDLSKKPWLIKADDNSVKRTDLAGAINEFVGGEAKTWESTTNLANSLEYKDNYIYNYNRGSYSSSNTLTIYNPEDLSVKTKYSLDSKVGDILIYNGCVYYDTSAEGVYKKNLETGEETYFAFDKSLFPSGCDKDVYYFDHYVNLEVSTYNSGTYTYNYYLFDLSDEALTTYQHFGNKKVVFVDSAGNCYYTLRGKDGAFMEKDNKTYTFPGETFFEKLGALYNSYSGGYGSYPYLNKYINFELVKTFSYYGMSSKLMYNDEVFWFTEDCNYFNLSDGECNNIPGAYVYVENNQYYNLYRPQIYCILGNKVLVLDHGSYHDDIALGIFDFDDLTLPVAVASIGKAESNNPFMCKQFGEHLLITIYYGTYSYLNFYL